MKYKKMLIIIMSFIAIAGCTIFPVDKNIVPVTASADQLLDGSFKIYLPSILKNYPPKNIMGAQLSQINDQKGLSLMVDAESAWTRLDYPWSLVQPVEGQILWNNAASIDQQLVNASNENMEVLLILGATPEWARFTGWPCGGKISPDKYTAFYNFMFSFVRRYSNPPYNVTYFEMWNEPEAPYSMGCWGDPADSVYYGGQAYGEMLKLAHQAANAANPDAQILVGGLLLDCDPTLDLKNADETPKNCGSANFLNGILETGAENSFDGVSFHAYDYYYGGLGKYGNANFSATWDTTGPVTLEKAEFIRQILSQYGVTGKYLMNTEAGLLCASCESTDTGLQITKAYYVAQEFASALADGYEANIWFSVYGDRNSGLLTTDNQPYPAYYAFAFTTDALLNYDFARELNVDAHVMGYEFVSKTGKKQWVLWSIDGLNHTISLSSMPSSINKISDTGHGEAITPATSVTIGIAPVFIKY